MTTQDLINELKKETAEIRVQYLERAKISANEKYDLMATRLKWTDAEWCTFIGLTPQIRFQGCPNEYITFPLNFHNTSAARKYSNERKKIMAIVVRKKDDYVDREIKYANLHFDNIIEKLVYRIEKKGLNFKMITVVHARVGVNLETTITDGKLTINAYTIVAGGPVQQDHFRYLIK